MNCKPGDLAVFIRDEAFPQNVGRLVRVRVLADSETARDFYCSPMPDAGDEWVVEPCTTLWGWGEAFTAVEDDSEVLASDSDLRSIRDPGDDAQDETLSWLPVPSRDEVAA